MSKNKTAKPLLLSAYEKSSTKTVADVCRIAGLARNTFYWHYGKDAEFRRELLKIQLADVSKKLESEPPIEMTQ